MHYPHPFSKTICYNCHYKYDTSSACSKQVSIVVVDEEEPKEQVEDKKQDEDIPHVEFGGDGTLNDNFFFVKRGYPKLRPN